MGANESRNFSSIVDFVTGFILLIIHFAFVIVSELFAFWRSCSHDEGLQNEIEATNKDGDCVRKRLQFQDAQLERFKEMQDLSADAEQQKYGETIILCFRFSLLIECYRRLKINETIFAASLEDQYKDTVARLQKMQSLASNLNVQLAQTSVEVETLRQERDELLDKLSAQEKLVRDILQTSTEERDQIAAKMKHDYEQLRNVNCDREEHLMEDCEWKLRSMMKQCKEKLDNAEKEKTTLKDQAQLDKTTIKSQRDEIKNLKACERESASLRQLTGEQKDSISAMMRRVDDLKSELGNVKRRLQDEIDSCLQIKRDCA